MSWILGIHAAGSVLGLGLRSRLSGEVRAAWWPLDRQLSSHMHVCLQSFIAPLKWSDISAIAVATGPGSFTSYRLGVTLARTLAHTLSIPAVGITTLEAIAANFLSAALEPTIVSVAIDAKRSEWIGALYYGHGNDIAVSVAPQLWTDPDWQNQRQGTIGLGEPLLPPVLALIERANYLGFEHAASWADLVPFYGRQPPIHGT